MGQSLPTKRKGGTGREGHKHLQSCPARQVEVEPILAGGTTMGKDLGVKIRWVEGIG